MRAYGAVYKGAGINIMNLQLAFGFKDVLADMPGVKAKDLAIDLRENTLTLSGDVESPEGANEEEVLREYRTGNYYRQFTLSEGIDQSKIEAALKDGVIRLRLPKVEAAAPRTIPVKTE